MRTKLQPTIDDHLLTRGSDRLLASQLSELSRREPVSILVAYLAVITTVWIHWDIATTSRLMGWLFFMSVVLLIRFIASKKNAYSIKTHAQVANWRNLRVSVSVFYGIGWGAMLFLLNTGAFDFYLLFKLATLTGVLGVTVNTMSVLLPVYVGFVTPIILMDILFTFTNTPYLPVVWIKDRSNDDWILVLEALGGGTNILQ